MGDSVKKQVKVDNWGMFFLQRIQQHFASGKFCDVTLHFSNNETIKAHRLVLDICSEYFVMLEKQGKIVDDCINMPPDMPADVVVPVINFMYTGRLEFRADIQNRLYLTAQKMKMAVLTKLLDAQSLNAKQQRQSGTTAITMLSKKKTFPPGTFTNLQGKKISPRIVDPHLPQTLPGRKLPIWTRRSMPAYSGISMGDFDRPIRIITPAVDEVPRPTRFEWPDDDDDNTVSPLRTTFEDISYESKPLMQLKEPIKPITPLPRVQQSAPQRTATFEEVLRTGAVTKRPITSPISNDSAKKSKMLDLQAVKEYVQETQVRKNMLKEDSDEDVDNDLDDLNNGDDDDDEEYIPTRHVTPHKSILKTQSLHDEEGSTASAKKVRFSLDSSSLEEKENAAKVIEKLPTRASTNAGSGSGPSAPNHAKIISEVLKKYPHLVKNNKNIRLKIMQRGGTTSQIAESGSGRAIKSKVSYVVLKSDVVDSKGNASMGIKQGCLVEHQSSVKMQPKLATGAENVNGPWLCHSCGSNEEPIAFETYFDYRHHLQDVHMEKIDARICEHCGHRASKRNLLLYHQFTKHGVAPPRNCQFPKCDQCDYVALSESLLIKHRNNHSNTRDYMCKVCNTSFKSNGALQGHMQANLHSDPFKKLYECLYCSKQFARNINLKAHLRQFHKDEARRLDDDDLELEGLGDDLMAEDGEGQVMEVPVINMINQTSSGMTILAEAPAGLECSSEAEGLSHVASGIATSLGLADGQQTVILLDENQEFIIHTTEIVGNEYMHDGSIVQQVQEYIVPEMIGEDQTTSQEDGSDSVLCTEPHLMHGQEEVMMVLTDHCYAEEVVTREEPLQTQEGYTADDQSHFANSSLSNEVTCDQDENKDNIEQALTSFENDVALKSTKRIFTSRLTSETVNSAASLVPTFLKTYSPTKKLALPVPTSNMLSSSTKPALVMSDLLDDWDEDLSQETDGHQESMIPRHPDALPTRADVSDDMYVMARVQEPLVEQMPMQPTEQEPMPEMSAESGESFHEPMDADGTHEIGTFNGEHYTIDDNKPLPPFTEIAQPPATTEGTIAESEADDAGMSLGEHQTNNNVDEAMEHDGESFAKDEAPVVVPSYAQESEQALMPENQEQTFEENAGKNPHLSEQGNTTESFSSVAEAPLEAEHNAMYSQESMQPRECPHEQELNQLTPNLEEESTVSRTESDLAPPISEKSNEILEFVKESIKEETEQNPEEVNEHRLSE